MTNSKLKDSNIEWLGKIPSNWNLIKGKYLFTLRTTKGNTKQVELLSPTQEYGVIPQKLYEKLTGMRPVKLKSNTDLNQMKSIYKGDFCISLRSFQGGFEYSNYDGIVSPAYQVFYPSKQVNRNYFKYLFKDKSFIQKLNSYTMSLRDGKNIAFSDFGNTYLPFPALDEQNKIADFLDKKVSQIDNLSKNIQQEITDLEEYRKSIITKAVTTGLNKNIQMKDSNIDYINKMPNTWHLTRLKYILTERNQRSIDGKELLLSVSQKKGILPAYQVKRSIKANSLVGYKIVKQNDLVFNKLNPALARFGVSNYNGITSPDFSVYYSNKINIQFLSFLLKTSKYVTEYKRLCSGVGEGYTRLYTPTLYNIKVALPTIKEQNKIVNILNKKDQKIKKLMEKQKRLLLTLTQYKQSLIYEYVTGKKQVSSKESAKA
ncbi:restriction endonuclease subunit S [Lactobacillus amylovorus]|uniref:restriction endonuclease subunit S n=1 Tax=Lactobacillus amylovorus TaxID=1604 RepID=UPI0022E81020|nr:restriction endonuclease subunit S [Lactobacillus amylovorus]MDB6232641.1 restriction endonuclease subunit S [Lactobacillus amylovorus]